MKLQHNQHLSHHTSSSLLDTVFMGLRQIFGQDEARRRCRFKFNIAPR